jgi:hypothetical protein
MRNLFALIGLLVVVVGGAGWYLGWYKVNVSKNPDGNLKIQTDVDTKKLAGDSSAFFQKVGQMVNEKTQQIGQNGTSPPDNAPVNTPATAPQSTNFLPNFPGSAAPSTQPSLPSNPVGNSPTNTNQTTFPSLPLPPGFKP